MVQELTWVSGFHSRKGLQQKWITVRILCLQIVKMFSRSNLHEGKTLVFKGSQNAQFGSFWWRIWESSFWWGGDTWAQGCAPGRSPGNTPQWGPVIPLHAPCSSWCIYRGERGKPRGPAYSHLFPGSPSVTGFSQRIDQNENRINPKKSIQNHVTLNFPNTKSKDLKAEKNDILSIGENSNDSGFLMSNNGNQKELT